MPTEIVVAIIALAGVIISVTVSLYVGLRQTNSELMKVRSELQQACANKLLEKRIEVYPRLYALLSDFTKRNSGHTKMSLT